MRITINMADLAPLDDALEADASDVGLAAEIWPDEVVVRHEGEGVGLGYGPEYRPLPGGGRAYKSSIVGTGISGGGLPSPRFHELRLHNR